MISRKIYVDWIARGCPFPEGVQMIITSGKTHKQIRQFIKYSQASFIPKYWREKLRFAIRDLIQDDPGHTHSPQPSPQVGSPAGKTRRGKEPVQVVDLRGKARMLLKQYSACHTEMRISTDKARRYEMADKIIRVLMPDIDQIYDQIRKWQATGEIPAQTMATSEQDRIRAEAVAWMKERAAVKTQLSRTRAKLKKAPTAIEAAKVEKQLGELKDLLQKIEQKLGIYGD